MDESEPARPMCYVGNVRTSTVCLYFICGEFIEPPKAVKCDMPYIPRSCFGDSLICSYSGVVRTGTKNNRLIGIIAVIAHTG